MRLVLLLSLRLTSLRAKFGLTQERFAEIAGFEYKFYQAIESGRKKQLWLETVERLASAYGLEAWELIGPREPAHARYPQMAQVGEDAALPKRRPGRPRKVAGESSPVKAGAPAAG